MRVETKSIQGSVLVLNRSWVAVHVASVRRALSLVYRGLARVVNVDDYQTYDFESWKEASTAARERCIATVNFRIRIPEVILLGWYNHIPKREVVLNRKNIFERDGNTCQYCGKRARREDLTLDHVLPRSRGGKNTWENLVLACVGCNKRKRNRTTIEAGMKLMRQPVKPRTIPGIGLQITALKRVSWQRFLNRAYWETELRDD